MINTVADIELFRKREGLLFRKGHQQDVGLDVMTPSRFCIYPNQTLKIALGFALELPDCVMAVVKPRSSVAARGIIVHEAPIDPGYTGEIYAIMTNVSGDTQWFDEGDAIGQLVFIQTIWPIFTRCGRRWGNNKDKIIDLVKTEPRGDGAFGSTDAED
jgi:dUTP pyrophosphatase